MLNRETEKHYGHALVTPRQPSVTSLPSSPLNRDEQMVVATIPPHKLLGKPPFLPHTQAQLVALGNNLTRPFVQATQEFWHNHLNLHFVGLLPNAETYFLPGESLFVSQYPLPGHPDVYFEVRLSELGCRWLLETSLGEAESVDAIPANQLLSRLTPLESTILENWCHQLFSDCGSALPLPAPESLASTTSTLDFLWVMSVTPEDSSTVKGEHNPLTDDQDYGKLILRVPKSYLRYYLAANQTDHPPKENTAAATMPALEKALPTVLLGLGHTRLPLDDLQALEIGDVLLLEDSHYPKVTISLPGQPDSAFTARLALPPATLAQQTLHLQRSPDQGYEAEYSLPSPELTEKEATPMAAPPTESTPQQAFWNQLHIDVHACFEPVRIPLNDLQQLSQGLIMEVGDLTDNQIRLQVDDNTIATGELVIVGDKFGVRITHVAAEGGEPRQQTPVVEAFTPVTESSDSNDIPLPGDGEPATDEGLPIAVGGDDDTLPIAVDSGDEPSEAPGADEGIPLAAPEGGATPDSDDDDDW